MVLSGCLNRLGFRPFYGIRERKLASAAIRELDLEDIKNDSFRELSGGQQQRVLLARALCATKKLLLLDEPVTGLDPLISAELYRIVKDINRAHGITVIMVSHDVCGALEEATKVLHLGDMQQQFLGAPTDYLQTDFGKYFTRGMGRTVGNVS